jgi:predicted regulator of amino acid metabolism with ACT domain
LLGSPTARTADRRIIDRRLVDRPSRRSLGAGLSARHAVLGRGMFDEIMGKFAGSPGQQAVVRLLLERGFSVNGAGRVVSGGIEIPDTQVASEVGVDRRVVDATTETVLEDEELRRIFRNISAVPSLMDLAPVLDLSVLTVEVSEADETGIVAAVAGAVADHDIPIRQLLTDDPEFSAAPRLYLVTDAALPGALLTEIRDMAFVRRIELE